MASKKKNHQYLKKKLKRSTLPKNPKGDAYRDGGYIKKQIKDSLKAFEEE